LHLTLRPDLDQGNGESAGVNHRMIPHESRDNQAVNRSRRYGARTPHGLGSDDSEMESASQNGLVPRGSRFRFARPYSAGACQHLLKSGAAYLAPCWADRRKVMNTTRSS
jgi:hypothetical protein